MYRPVVTLPEILARLAGSSKIEVVISPRKVNGCLRIEAMFMENSGVLLFVDISSVFCTLDQVMQGYIPWSDVVFVGLPSWTETTFWFRSHKKALCYHVATHDVEVRDTNPLRPNLHCGEITSCVVELALDSARIDAWLKVSILPRDLVSLVAAKVHQLMYA